MRNFWQLDIWKTTNNDCRLWNNDNDYVTGKGSCLLVMCSLSGRLMSRSIKIPLGKHTRVDGRVELIWRRTNMCSLSVEFCGTEPISAQFTQLAQQRIWWKINSGPKMVDIRPRPSQHTPLLVNTGRYPPTMSQQTLFPTCTVPTIRYPERPNIHTHNFFSPPDYLFSRGKYSTGISH